MTWSLYQVNLRVLSPVHIGWRKTGNLQQTRPYVTGRNLWGAFTARLVRDQEGTDYPKCGKKVNEELIFSYFYLTTIPGKVKVWPWKENFDEFCWQYLDSYSGTALNGRTAEEGTLHETEYISPTTRLGEQVYLVGYIIEKEGSDLDWQDALKRIQLGGERGYGWGRVEIADGPEKSDKCFGYKFDGTGESPAVTVPKGDCILAHTLAEGLDLKGEIEPFVGRETSKSKGFGGIVSSADICWVPGSAVNEDMIFRIQPKGLWDHEVGDVQMIEKLSIKNFKSIQDLEIDCKRINLFIGEPNTGKSNILEALGLLSWVGYGQPELKEYVRFQGTQNLFYDELLDRPVRIHTDNLELELIFKDDEFFIEGTIKKDGEKPAKNTICSLNYSGKPTRTIKSMQEGKIVKLYRFTKQNVFQDPGSSFLLPPHGSNLFAVVMANKKFRDTMARFFRNFGLNLVLRPQERTFEVQKQVGDIVFSYPYALTSDTLQTILFHVIAIESNRNSTLVFEEPESHAFPYYTKYLGEKIALDTSNQYFIATHNPYLLLSILEKAQKDSVNVYIIYFQDYQTKVKCLTENQLSDLMDYDPFFNLNSFIEEE